jgi:hypothetical protein
MQLQTQPYRAILVSSQSRYVPSIADILGHGIQLTERVLSEQQCGRLNLRQ